MQPATVVPLTVDGASWFCCAASSAQSPEQKGIDFVSSDNAFPSSILSCMVDVKNDNSSSPLVSASFRQVTRMKGVASKVSFPFSHICVTSVTYFRASSVSAVHVTVGLCRAFV